MKRTILNIPMVSGSQKRSAKVRLDLNSARWCRACLLVGLLALAAHADEKKAGDFHEDFSNLDAWKPLTFPKIERHSSYSIVKKDGASVLKASVFGEKPPRKAYLAIMSDADNTGEKAIGFIDDIELAPKPSNPDP
ncbi:MAG: hypothetical protein RRC34_05445 [Lentisphaeria bacterium]|nr:hypothetical protein [Lentisphaeria bacterium]